MIASAFHPYNELDHRDSTYDRCSPALVELLTVLRATYGGASLGCFSHRSVRGGTRRSTHSWGGALDVSYSRPGRHAFLNKWLPYLIAYSEEWGIMALHDYVGQRIWRAGRTPNESDSCTLWWKAQRPDSSGMGQDWATWVHIEVHPNRWHDGRTAAERGAG